MKTLTRLTPGETAAIENLAQQSGLYSPAQIALITEKCLDAGAPQPMYGYAVITHSTGALLDGFILIRPRSLTRSAFEVAELGAAHPDQLPALIQAACAEAIRLSGTLILAEYPDAPQWESVAAQLIQKGFVLAGATPHLYGPGQGTRHYVRHFDRPAQATYVVPGITTSTTSARAMDDVAIASTVASQRSAIVEMTEATTVFGADDLAVVQELLDLYLRHGADYGYSFLSAQKAGAVLGYACFGPRPAARGAYDLYWICTDPRRRQQGVGRSLMAAVEAAVLARGGYLVVLETSGADQFDPTRRFYEAIGYSRRVWIEDFFAPWDGLVVFARYLRSPSG